MQSIDVDIPSVGLVARGLDMIAIKDRNHVNGAIDINRLYSNAIADKLFASLNAIFASDRQRPAPGQQRRWKKADIALLENRCAGLVESTNNVIAVVGKEDCGRATGRVISRLGFTFENHDLVCVGQCGCDTHTGDARANHKDISFDYFGHAEPRSLR